MEAGSELWATARRGGSRRRHLVELVKDGLRRLVNDADDRRVGHRRELRHDAHDAGRRGGVETGGGLVEEEERRPLDQAGAQGQPAQLSARKGARLGGLGGGEAEALEHLVDRRLASRRVQLRTHELERVAQLLAHREHWPDGHGALLHRRGVLLVQRAAERHTCGTTGV